MIDEFFDDSILNAHYRQLWWTPHLSAARNEHDNHYMLGLGWFMVESALGTFFGHNSGIQGFASAFLYLPDTQTTGIVLCNTNYIENPHRIALDLIAQLQSDDKKIDEGEIWSDRILPGIRRLSQ